MDDKQLSLFDGTTIDPKTKPSEKDLETARNRENLIKIYSASIPVCVPRTGRSENKKGKVILKFLADYNSGAYPTIFEDLREVSKATFYNWLRNYREGGVDALIPQYKCRSPKVSRAEDRCLRELLIDRIRIGQAIFITKYFLKRKGVESPSSPSTLRRWASRLLEKK